jgi:hypothetical protein
MAHPEGGGVKVDGGSTIMTKSLRKRMAMARFEAGVKAVVCSVAGDEARCASGLGSRTVGRGDGVTTSRVTVEQERA